MHTQGDRVSDDYRASHCAPGYGAHYNKTHDSGYYGALWEKIEKPLILDVLRPMGGAGRNCLDFAWLCEAMRGVLSKSSQRRKSSSM